MACLGPSITIWLFAMMIIRSTKFSKLVLWVDKISVLPPCCSAWAITRMHCCSCALSIEAVGSSSSQILGLVSTKRVNATSCFCPPDRPLPPSLMGKSMPFEWLATSRISPVVLSACCSTSSDGVGIPINKFSRNVPWNKRWSCCKYPTCSLRLSRLIWLISSPSSSTRPSVVAYSPDNNLSNVDLPEPMAPKMAMRSPALILRLGICKAGWSLPAYLNTTPWHW